MSYLTGRKRTAYQFVGTEALVISERISQSHLHNPTHKQQVGRLPCRHTGAYGKTYRADETGAGCHGAVKSRKCLRMGTENE